MRALLALVCGTVLSGCLGAVPFKPRAYDEAVRVKAVAVDFKADGTGLVDLELEVHNPSSDAATLTGVDFELRVDGRRVAVGAQQVAAPLAPEATAPLRVLFPLAGEKPSGAGEPVARQVRVTGGVVLRFGGTERRAAFEARRELPLSWVPPPSGPESG